MMILKSVWTHSLLVVGVHEVLVPSPEVWQPLELGHSQNRDVSSVANQLRESLHGLGFHIGGCWY